MATARDLVQSAYRLVGVLAAGQTMSGDRAQVGLDALNQMLDAWNVDGFTVYSVSTSVVNTTSGINTYTIGAGGNISVPTRPTSLISAAARDNSSSPPLDTPITILEAADYNLIATKDTENSTPFFLYYEPSFPLGVMTLYPVPNTNAQLVIQYLNLHNSALTLDSVLSFPPAYYMAIRFNLAVLLAIEAGRQQVNPAVLMKAEETKSMLEKANTRVPTLSYGVLGGGEYDIISDSWR